MKKMALASSILDGAKLRYRIEDWPTKRDGRSRANEWLWSSNLGCGRRQADGQNPLEFPTAAAHA
jgi:hypothetical protein